MSERIFNPQRCPGQQQFRSQPSVFIYLGVDASPQGGKDFQMSLEDVIRRDSALVAIDWEG